MDFHGISSQGTIQIERIAGSVLPVYSSATDIGRFIYLNGTGVLYYGDDVLGNWRRAYADAFLDLTDAPKSYAGVDTYVPVVSGASIVFKSPSLAHTSLSGGTLHAAATESVAGFMSSADKYRVDSSFVEKATYDANTILYATTDNIPVALTVGTSSVVGRKASGAIVSLSSAEAGTILGAGVRDTYRNLKVYNNVTHPTYAITASFDELVLQDTSGNAVKVGSSTLTGTLTAAASAGGLDTGSEAPSVWYHIWVISNVTTAITLFSLSPTVPTMPAGYTFKSYIGAVYNDSSSNFIMFYQVNNMVSSTYQRVLTLYNSTAIAPIDISAHIPSTAKCFIGQYYLNSASGTYINLYSDYVSPIGQFYLYGNTIAINEGYVVSYVQGQVRMNIKNTGYLYIDSNIDIVYVPSIAFTLDSSGWEY